MQEQTIQWHRVEPGEIRCEDGIIRTVNFGDALVGVIIDGVFYIRTVEVLTKQ